ncbi:hypothetical protein F53441_13784 [Fusarium austroafricanum]|uniref:Uncharacterized protein n=1 Tax=Fusarium austroafricanum TaxID=2364996 RepID=A0A8H4NJG8_9HYPO|nr:hypothetical protein F53441_13784 [Fusarium austroafricanum]
MAQVIGLDPEASVTSGSGAPYPRTTIPPALTSSSASASASTTQKPSQYSYQHLQRPGSQTQAQARTRPRAKSLSNLLSRLDKDKDKDVEFHDDTFIDQQQEDGKPQDDLAELIDFLRNHSPPPGNFMSIPDHISPEDRGRWYRLRKLGKRSKSLSKSPQTIRLPDSAVSGTTIGGHRHIAISIPLDASPFGRTPRSQYPVYQHRSVRPFTSQYAPTRAVLNDKGVVTVLRTVAEDRESSPSVSPANSQLLLSTIPQRSLTSSNEEQYSSGAVDSSNQTSPPEHLNVLAALPRVVTPDQVRQANEHSREFQNSDQGSMHAGNPKNHERVPSRNPSLTGRFVYLGDLSIDTMMSQPTNTEGTRAPISPARPVSQDGSYQPSLSKSIMTTSENDPVIAEARPIEARPVAARESRIRPSAKKSEEPSVTVTTKSPLRVHREASNKQTTKERSSNSKSKMSQSRRDKVRDKKKRDMEAASLKRRSMISISSDPQPESEQETIKELPGSNAEEPPPVPLRSPQRQSMCPIMVVANVKPSPPPSAVFSNSPEKQTSEKDVEDSIPVSKSKPGGTVPKRPGDNASSRAISPSPASYVNGSPTPPQSAQSSPANKLGSQDRTSLSRRREWSAAREHERKRREAASNASPRPRARRIPTTKAETVDKTPSIEKEVLRRYEAYREYRIREMERRVRRLERNGDVWLRALVPVLDNLNRTLTNTQDEQPSRAKGWISDDDRSHLKTTSHIRPSSRGRMMTRSGTSEREFLEQLVKTKEELEAGSVSDDMSGFDTIEPLMRELAGRSRLSFEARSLGMDDEGLLQSLSE